MSGVQSVERTFAILEAVATNHDGVRATQIAQRVDLPKSTVSRLLSTLEGLGAIAQVPDTRRFRIGPGVVALASGVSFAEYLRVLARPYLLELTQTIDEATMLCLPDCDQAYYVEQIQGQRPIQVQDWTGVRVPLHFSPSGLVLLAHWRQESVERYLAQPLEQFSAQTVTDPDQLRQLLARIREQGFVWTHEEELELSGLAAPIKNGSAIPVATLSVFGPSFRFPPDGRKEEITRLVIKTGQDIAKRLEGTPIAVSG